MLKELRLQEIKTIEGANQFAQEYIEIYNKKFSKKPRSEFDAHRPLIRRLKGKQVEVRATRAGEMRVFLQGKELVVFPLDQVIEEPQLALSRAI